MRPLVIGIGNPHRGDDAAGRRAARELAGCEERDFDVAEASGEMAELLALIDAREQVVLIDACAGGAPPGTLHRFDVSAAPLPAHMFNLSTHGFGPAEAVELARALGRLPRRAVVIAIEGTEFAPGAPMSAEVAAAIGEATRLVLRELGPGK